MHGLQNRPAADAARAPDPTRSLLDNERDRAERTLNVARLAVLLLLGSAALVYAPSLSSALDRANLAVLIPPLLWALAQQRLFARRERLPAWLGVVNPVVDITAVTAIIVAYAVAQSPALALKSPIFLAYFAIFAALPLSASTRKAAAVAALALAEYALLLAVLATRGGLPLVRDPVAASGGGAVSILDEGAKLLLLAVAGGIATYAARWQERLATSYSRAAEERERLEARLAKAQLESLKQQLRPHFLFNTLNTITALINTDRRAAERVVSGLSELLRLSLGPAADQEVPLARELEVLDHYINIERLRFQDRLRVDFDVDPAATRGLVPSFVLQPLVENAIRHGIAPRAAPGRVEVRAERRNGMLELRVRDDGVGERRGTPRRDGVGLGNTRARLLSLYGDAHHFEATSPPGGGFEVRIALPYHEPAAAVALAR